MDSIESADEKLLKAANATDLEVAIQKLEERKSLQESELRAQFHTVIENLKPKNILKNTLADVRESSPLKSNLLKLALGLGVGYFSRKMVLNESASLVKKALGTAFQLGILHFLKRKKHTSADEDDTGKSATRKENYSQQDS